MSVPGVQVLVFRTQLNFRRNSSMAAVAVEPVKVLKNRSHNASDGKGFEVYLVGGCVRDLILDRTPKDFDILTSAELKEVTKIFQRCNIIGRRFPICHVHIDNTIVEVTSFTTTGRKFQRNAYNVVRRPPACSKADFIRWKDCLRRDFTINGLMFDPFAKIVFDYLGGLEDIRRAKVCM